MLREEFGIDISRTTHAPPQHGRRPVRLAITLCDKVREVCPDFTVAPAFADVIRGPLRLLLSGPTSSGARATPADAATAGRNRIHLMVDDLDAEINRIRSAGLSFRSELVTGPGGRQILLADPALVELFQPPRSPGTPAS